MIQNRKYDRIDAIGFVKIRNSQGEVSGKLLNVSERGLGISTMYTFITQDSVKVIFETGDTLKGKIAWTSMGKVGVELETMIPYNLLDKISRNSRVFA